MDIPFISRERLKQINPDSTETGKGDDANPTEKERVWLELMRSTDAARETLRKRASVCAIADIAGMSKEQVMFAYDGVTYTLKKPINSFAIARARELSVMAALGELNAQRCIVIGAVPINKDFSGIDAAAIKLMGDVAENFFFTPFL